MNTHGRVFDPLGDPTDGPILTKAIFDTIREPLIVLDEELRVVAASPSFYKKFGQALDTTHGKLFYELGNGQWDIPALRELLQDVIPLHTTVEGYEVEHDFKTLGLRTMLINAREIPLGKGRRNMLLAISDVTEERKAERDRERLMHQKDMLLKEMRHRIANSLQLIASIILLKASSVQSEESKLHLEDAHDRILSIATVQRNLDPSGENSEVPVVEYLRTLCESLTKSMISNTKQISIHVTGDAGVVTPDEAIGLGLITTELVINALKHAFPSGKGQITVTYGAEPQAWKLSIGDDGIGMSAEKLATQEGLGTSILDSLAKQLNADIHRESTPRGTLVSITHPNA